MCPKQEATAAAATTAPAEAADEHVLQMLQKRLQVINL